jgi:hypothetical protein
VAGGGGGRHMPLKINNLLFRLKGLADLLVSMGLHLVSTDITIDGG